MKLLLPLLILLPLTGLAQAPPPAPVCGPDQVSYIAVHVHFIQDANGGDNFPPQDDPATPRDESGYRWARGLVSFLNWPHGWNENPPMRLPVGNTTPNPPKNVLFVLKGVWFDRVPPAPNDSLRRFFYSYTHQAGDPPLKPAAFANYFDSWQYDTFGKDKGRAVNIFVMNNGMYHHPFFGHTSTHDRATHNAGAAPSPYWLKVVSPWRQWQLPPKPTGETVGNPWEYTSIVSHELGHSFGLAHTFGPVGGPDADGLADTPNNPNCWGDDSPACAGATPPQPSSNNMLDYNGCQCALTPMQLAVIHRSLDGPLHGLVTACGPLGGCLPVNCFVDLPTRAGRRPRHLYLDASACFHENAWTLEVMPVAARGSASPTDSVFTLSGQTCLLDLKPTPLGAGVLDLCALTRLRPRRVYRVRLRVWRDCDPASWSEQIRYVDTYRARAKVPTL